MTGTQVHLVLLQQFDLDAQVVSDLLVSLPLVLELFLGSLQFGQRAGVPWPQVQLLQVHAERIVLDPEQVHTIRAPVGPSRSHTL